MNDVSKEEKLDPAKPILWIVIPCYNEKDVLPITAPMFLEQIQTMISKEKISAKSRILFVNDGSKDSTWDIICKLAQEDEHYIGISQSRNRGHQNAVLAGLMEAKDVCIITGTGCVVSLIGFIGIIWAIITAIMGNTVAGWASIVCIVCFLGGIQLLSLGVIGEYIGKIYLESKHRPRYIISDKTWEPYERHYKG